jgi:hypothetical protein
MQESENNWANAIDPAMIADVQRGRQQRSD